MIQEEHWREHTLYQEHIARWTGDTQDVLSRDEILLAGCLYSLSNIDKGEKYLLSRGREVLRNAALDEVPKGTKRALRGGPTHRKAMKRPCRAPATESASQHP